VATTSNRGGASSLPDITFVSGADSIDYAPQRTSSNSFALGVDKLDLRNTKPKDLVQKFDGIADGLTSTVVHQVGGMASDINYVKTSL